MFQHNSVVSIFVPDYALFLFFKMLSTHANIAISASAPTPANMPIGVSSPVFAEEVPFWLPPLVDGFLTVLPVPLFLLSDGAFGFSFGPAVMY